MARKQQRERKTDKNGRALTKNGNYYSSARLGTKQGVDEYKDKDGVKRTEKIWVNGYNISKSRGKITFSGFENSRSKRYEGKQNRKRHVMMFVEVFFHNTGNTVVEYVDICLDSMTAKFEKLNMFADFNTYPDGSFTNIVKGSKKSY